MYVISVNSIGGRPPSRASTEFLGTWDWELGIGGVLNVKKVGRALSRARELFSERALR
jgi:hypothetical protein